MKQDLLNAKHDLLQNEILTSALLPGNQHSKIPSRSIPAILKTSNVIVKHDRECKNTMDYDEVKRLIESYIETR